MLHQTHAVRGMGFFICPNDLTAQNAAQEKGVISGRDHAS